MTYQHKQIGFVTISAFLLLFLFVIDLLTMSIMFWYDSTPAFVIPLLSGLALLSIILGILFSSMTVKIDDGQLTWHFALGFWKKTVDLADISSAQSVSNKWWYGWGIKRFPGGWLYNVSGMNAVEVRLDNGRAFRLGSDEPQELAQALESAKA